MFLIVILRRRVELVAVVHQPSPGRIFGATTLVSSGDSQHTPFWRFRPCRRKTAHGCEGCALSIRGFCLSFRGNASSGERRVKLLLPSNAWVTREFPRIPTLSLLDPYVHWEESFRKLQLQTWRNPTRVWPNTEDVARDISIADPFAFKIKADDPLFKASRLREERKDKKYALSPEKLSFLDLWSSKLKAESHQNVLWMLSNL